MIVIIVIIHKTLVNPGDNYSLRIQFINDYGYGVTVDNILISEGIPLAAYNWTTNSPNGNSGWSATDTEDITVTNDLNSNHIEIIILR